MPKLTQNELEELNASINKNLGKIENKNEFIKKLHLPLADLLNPADGHTPPNSFMLYCRDHEFIIKNKPGNNSKCLSKRWDNEDQKKKMIYDILSKVMSMSYKEVFTELKPWDESASMPTFCLNGGQSSQHTQDSSNTMPQPEITESQPFIDKELIDYLSYYNL
ncbi:hypothetical protein RclHR1_00040004 [Rhizophagus clarus]|uniref:HMG box domain-containing protein n=1 Tax=Rhizophagus clarus TaxID=94130 RepID=A0A2Z6RI89_9GLOM|nr:hypothetical protein RclHR1_00040004 [Rhizophagus clarus]GES91681.1 hypothetical protein GLOIN_2v1769419 [Rhizophagus clarus]